MTNLGLRSSRSVSHPAKFWHFLWRHFGIKCSAQPDLPVLDESTPMDQIPEWFRGARMNYAENLLRFEDDEKLAFYYTSERIEVRTYGTAPLDYGFKQHCS
jgi:acetoacetyl-CoA synthetase